MAGTLSVTSSQVAGGGNVFKHSVAWTSDASGNVNTTTFTMGSGSIVVVEFIPGSGGTQPTDLYDVDLLDANGTSMFNDGTGASIGANLSNTVASHKAALIVGTNSTPTYVRTWLHGGDYQLTVANAGNAKTGTVNIYMTPGVVL